MSISLSPKTFWQRIPYYPLGKTPNDLPAKTYHLEMPKRAIMSMSGYSPHDLNDWKVTNRQVEKWIVELLACLRHLCDHRGYAYDSLNQRSYLEYIGQRKECNGEAAPGMMKPEISRNPGA